MITHDQEATYMTIYFAPVGSGIGDVIVCLPVCNWLVEHSNEPVFLVARGPRQVNLSKVIPGLAGEVAEPDLDKVMKPGDRLINLRDHPLQKHHDWFSKEFQTSYPDCRISEILAAICADLNLNIDADLSQIKPLQFEVDERSRDKVILIPGTTIKAKMIAPHFWRNLYQSLQDMGVDCLVLGLLDRSKDTKALVEAGLPHIETLSIEQAINLISGAKAAVSVDTGLMHIAVQQGIKTVAVHGICEVYHRPAKNCIPIFTNAFHRSRPSSTEPAAPLRVPPAFIPPDSQYSRHDFPVRFTTWNWDPEEGVEDGEYLPFDDHKKVIELLSPF
jgi:hypothetical protein